MTAAAQIPCRSAPRGDRRRRALRGVVAAAAVAILLAAIVAAPLVAHTPRSWDGYRWRASSATHGWLREGRLGDRGRNDLLFHTRNEPKPWVIVDMWEPRMIDRVQIVNRDDCCAARGLPLVIEASVDGRKWDRLGARREPFAVLELGFPARPARFVRARSEATTYLHFREIRIP